MKITNSVSSSPANINLRHPNMHVTYYTYTIWLRSPSTLEYELALVHIIKTCVALIIQTLSPMPNYIIKSVTYTIFQD